MANVDLNVGRRGLIALGLVILLANIVGALVALFGVRFIASELSLFCGVAYGVASAVIVRQAFLAHSRSTIAVTSIVTGVFGALTVAHTVAYAYTRLVGESATRTYVVSSSYKERGIRRLCDGYQHHVSGIVWLAVSGDALCLDRQLPAGTTLSIAGPSSQLGLVVDCIEVVDGA